MSDGGGGHPYDDRIPRAPPALAVHPHHFALHAIETAFSNAAGLRAAAAVAGLQPNFDHQENLSHMGGVTELNQNLESLQNPQIHPHQNHHFHHQHLNHHHQQQQQQQILFQIENNVLSSPSSSSTHDSTKYAQDAAQVSSLSGRNVVNMNSAMPLDVQLTEGHLNSQTNHENGCSNVQQQLSSVARADDDEEEGDDDEEAEEDGGQEDGGVKKEVVESESPSLSALASDEEEVNVEKLRQIVAKISDTSLLWKVVRSRILSQCLIWDLLLDKACFRFYEETMHKQDDVDEKPREEKEGEMTNELSKLNATNGKKFKAVVSEMEVLLGEFKCLMDGCLQPHMKPKQVETEASAASPTMVSQEVETTTIKEDPAEDVVVKVVESEEKPKGVKVDDEVDEGICLSPELARAYDQTPDSKWSIKHPEEINALYQHFFCTFGPENENDRKDAMLSAEMMFNDFMPYGNKFDPSGYLDEEYDSYDDCDVKHPPPAVESSQHRKKTSTSSSSAYQDPSIYIYQCQSCPRRYKHSNNLKRHAAVCKGEPLIPNHQWKKTLDGRYYCTFPGCSEPDRNWATLQEVQKHFNRVHSKPGDVSFPCGNCEIKFSSRNLLNYHRRIKHLTRYPCTQCGKEFSSQSVLERHTQVHLGNVVEEEEETRPFACNLCHYRTNAHNGVALHKRSAHNVNKHDRPLAVEDIQNRDANGFAFNCERCTRRYKSTKNLLRHQKNCSGVPPPNVKPTWTKDPSDGRYYCTFRGCSTAKNWTCSSGVWKHYNTEHADVADPRYCVYPCDMCDERFPTKTMFNQHRKHKHLALFQFTCTVCSKRLPSTLRLKLHMRLHTGEKPYKCELCDYRSATQSAVNQHKMRMHEEHSHIALQRHVCEICGKSFKVKSNLKEHIRSHSDARTFLCGFCGKALKNRQCLNRHLFTHGVKYTCQNCGKNFANPSSLHVHRRDKHGVVQ